MCGSCAQAGIACRGAETALPGAEKLVENSLATLKSASKFGTEVSKYFNTTNTALLSSNKGLEEETGRLKARVEKLEGVIKALTSDHPNFLPDLDNEDAEQGEQGGEAE